MGFEFRTHGTMNVSEELCAGCGQCVKICPNRALAIDNGTVRRVDGGFMGCVACGHCTAVCPQGAIKIDGRGLSAEDSVELAPRDERATAGQLHALLATRRSVRWYDEKPVDRALLERIVEMASTAPVGIPPQEVGVVVFSSREKVQTFAAEACVRFRRTLRMLNPLFLGLMRPFIGKKKHAVMRDFIRPLLRALADERDEGTDVFTYDAPAAMLFHHSPFADAADCTVVATYAILAAESLGLSSCLLGTPAALSHHKDFKAKYGIPADNKVGLGLALGYAAVKFHSGVRRQFASVRF